MRKILALLLFVTFLVHGSVGLERALYINEILSAIGGLALAAMLFAQEEKSINQQEVPVLLILCLGLVHMLFGFTLNQEVGYYQKFRTLPIWYSVLCFYVGSGVIYKLIYRGGGGASFYCLKYIAIPLSLASGGLVSTASVVSLSMVREKSRALFFLAIAVFLILRISIDRIASWEDGNITSIILLVITLILYKFGGLIRAILRSNKLFMCSLLLFFVAVMVLKLIALKFSLFFAYGFSLFDESTDMNSIWRLMFWAKTINDMSITQLITGIGLGTPIFNEYDPAASFIIASSPDSADHSYTLGMHNSFLTFYVRLGIPGIALLLYIVTKCVNDLARMECQGSERLLVTLILILIPALFNVVLESPLYAGFFWAILGVCVRYAGDLCQEDAHTLRSLAGNT